MNTVHDSWVVQKAKDKKLIGWEQQPSCDERCSIPGEEIQYNVSDQSIGQSLSIRCV